MEKLRIGMIGCGQIMPATAKGILGGENCQMVRLLDIDPVALGETKDKYGVAAENDLFALLYDDEIEAVYIAIPHALHAAVAVEALRAGKHVMIEKPMATTPGDAHFIVAEADKSGKTAGVAMSQRFTACVEKARELIKKGAIGDISSTHIRELGFKVENYWSNGVGGTARRSTWRAFQGMAGGGILIMNAVHFLDSMYYMTGLTPKSAFALGGTYRAPAAVEDSISVLLSYAESNAYGVCEAMSSAFGAYEIDNGSYIYGTKGTIRIIRRELSLCTSVEGMGVPTGSFQVIPVEDNSDRALLMDDFANACRTGGKPRIPVEDGALITGTICAAYRSLVSGRPEEVI